MIRCPWCSTLQPKAETLLGRLGRLTHFRCRYCGGQFSKKARRSGEPRCADCAPWACTAGQA